MPRPRKHELTPAERSLRGRIGGLTRAAFGDMKALAQTGQAALMEKFRQQVDPDGVYTPAERERRALALRDAHMLKMRLARGRTKAKKKAPA